MSSSDENEQTTDRPGVSPRADAVRYFDGTSSLRRAVTLVFAETLEIREDGELRATWAYGDIRRADGPPGTLRLSCVTASPLARLEIHDADIADCLTSRCERLDANAPGKYGIATIVGWSAAAVISIVGVILFGIPIVADRLTPLVPAAMEKRLGDAVAGQVKTLFGNKVCDNASGQAAFVKLVNTVRDAAGLNTSVEAEVLRSPIPNAFALPAGRVYVFNGLLAKAANADEIAGVLAHEFGHVKHRDGLRNLIHNGGTSFLVGLLFGDITGSATLIFAARSLLDASYSRDAERDADTFSIDMMHGLGRPTKPMGELLFRITGKQGDSDMSILASHPLTEDRLARMTSENLPATGQPLLTPQEWLSLKGICDGKD